MKAKFLFTSLVLSIASIVSYGQEVVLPKPALSEEATLKYALENRCSQREYIESYDIKLQDLSNLLWAGWGYNREGKRTAPSALDRQEITLYVCTHGGTYEYNAEEHKLIKVSSKDLMQISGKQPFVETASVNLIYVCNTDLSASPIMSGVCCGAISQNISLYCASAGLATVVRGSFDANTLKKALKLSDLHEIVLAQSIGYPAHDNK